MASIDDGAIYVFGVLQFATSQEQIITWKYQFFGLIMLINQIENGIEFIDMVVRLFAMNLA